MRECLVIRRPLTKHEISGDDGRGPRHAGVTVNKHASTLSRCVDESEALVEVATDVGIGQVKNRCVFVNDAVSVDGGVNGQTGHIEDVSHVVLGEQARVSGDILGACNRGELSVTRNISAFLDRLIFNS